MFPHAVKHACELSCSRELLRLYRHFGDATNSDVMVAFSGTSVTVLKTLAHEGQ